MSELPCPYCGFKCEIPCTIPCTEEKIECPSCRSIFLYIQKSTSHGTIDYRPSPEIDDKSIRMSELKAIYATDKDSVTGLYYLKSEADKVITELEQKLSEIQAQKMQLEDDIALIATAKESITLNRTCRKCGRVGTLMHMPIVKDGRIYWDLYNNKGIDYVFGIRCAHCGEVAFVTKNTHEYELRHQKYKRCLAMAEACRHKRWRGGIGEEGYDYARATRHMNVWLELADKFKE